MTTDLHSLADERPRSRRKWLLLPLAGVVLLLAAWCVGWFVVSGELTRRIDRQAEALRNRGWTVTLNGRRLSGFPFRLRLQYAAAELRSPGGWALSVPGLEAQAYLHAPDHWVVVAPHGLTFVRPKGGPVAVRGESLRASFAGLRDPIWRVVLDGRKLVFTPSPDARPFSLSGAELIDAYLQPGVQPGAARWLVRVQDGRGAQNALLGLVAGTKPFQSRSEGRITRLDAWRSTPGAARGQHWAAAGGALQVDRSELNAGKLQVSLAEPSVLTAGADGRLRGVLPLDVQPALAALAVIGATGSPPEVADQAAQVIGGRVAKDAARLSLAFEAGATTLGPVRIGPAPKLF